MTQTAAPPPTIEALNGELSEARQRIVEAEQDLGAATLSRKGVTAATKQLEAAQADAKRLTAALEVLEQREIDEGARAERQAESDRRRELYEWALAYIAKLDELATAKRSFENAEAAVAETFAQCPRRNLLSRGVERHVENGFREDRSFVDTDIDPVMRRIPVPGLGQLKPRDLSWDIEAPHRRPVIERLNELIDAERQGAAAPAAL